MAGSKVGPFAQVCFAEKDHAGVPQFPGYKRILRPPGPNESQGARGGHHSIGSIDVVLDQNGDTVQWTARSFFFALTIK